MQGCRFGVGALRVHPKVPDLTLEPTLSALMAKNCNDTILVKCCSLRSC